MKIDILWNFISPVTGRILSTTDYILIGDRAGIATPSPILIDIRLDLINLRRDYNISTSADYVIGTPNIQLPNAQVLNAMPNGYVYNTIGVVSTIATIPIEDLPDLTTGNIWIGDDTNRPVANPTISLSNLPDLTGGKIWIGSSLNRPIEGYAIPGPRGPIGDQGPIGPPGLDATAVLKEVFIKLLQAIFGGFLGGLTASVINKLFEEWLNILLKGVTGIIGSAGSIGAIGLSGIEGIAGLFGQATQIILDKFLIRSNINMEGNRIENISQSPQGDFDAISAKWAWDLLHDNVIIKWE
jgi:hypothetical protein